MCPALRIKTKTDEEPPAQTEFTAKQFQDPIKWLSLVFFSDYELKPLWFMDFENFKTTRTTIFSNSSGTH